MQVIELDEIRSRLPCIDLIKEIEAGFVALSQGQAVVPPVGELVLGKGEVHIKYGFIRTQSDYVIKIASGFYENAALGLSTSNGCMLLFCQNTGQLKCILLDEGHLTDVRTAVAGAIAAKYLAPKTVRRIGIAGTGIQARAQLQYLASVVADCRDVLIFGRSQEKLDDCIKHFRTIPCLKQFRIETTLNIDQLPDRCNLIVTTTPATQPLIFAERVKPGTHITAVGSDMPDKQELESDLLAAADLVVADSIDQCKSRGEISHAIRDDRIRVSELVELGDVIAAKHAGRTDENQITIADLTGVAVQDIQIAAAVFYCEGGKTGNP